MESVTVSRTLDATPAAVRAAMEDVGPFMAAAGFDEVDVEGDTLRITNRVGILTLAVVDDAESDLAYEQRDGIFDEMRTAYAVTATPEGSEVTATTDFALDIAVVGDALDATVIKRQRAKELEAQFDWLESTAG
jgi:carbon monoxide dehydrogenase subunit G